MRAARRAGRLIAEQNETVGLNGGTLRRGAKAAVRRIRSLPADMMISAHSAGANAIDCLGALSYGVLARVGLAIFPKHEMDLEKIGLDCSASAPAR